MSESQMRLVTESEGMVGHHFEDLEQQREANVVGMWVFLATEIMFFGAMILGYLVYRQAHPAVFAEASRHLDVVLGTINTGVLLCSSLTMVLAVYAAQSGKRRAAVAFLLFTMLLGLTFLSIKGLEYYHKYEERLLPLEGLPFVYDGAAPQQAQLFFNLYLILTGIHAVHLLIGVLIVAVLAFFVWRGRFLGAGYMPVELVGLYWHFVDVVWVFLFPFLYLIDRT